MFNLPPLKVYLIVVAISFAGAFQLAYILLLLNPLQSEFEQFINSSFNEHYGRPTKDWELRSIYSLLINAAIIGGLFAGMSLLRLPDKFGRINTFWICNIANIIGFSLCAVSKYLNAFEVYIFGRLLNGYGSVLMYSLQSVYFTEVADKRYRGFLNGQTGLFNTFGQVVGLLAGMPVFLGTAEHWPIAHWLQFIPVSLASVALLFAPESPKHLMANGQIDQCKTSCKFCFGSDADLDSVLAEINRELAMTKKQLGLRSVWNDDKLLRGVVVGCVANTMVSFSGLVAVNFFTIHLLLSAGLSHLNASLATLFISLVGVAGALTSALVLDSWGRRPILLWSAASKCLLNTLVMVCLLLYARWHKPWLAVLVVVALTVLKFFLEAGAMQVAAFISAELAPQNAKALAQGSGTLVRYVSLTLVTQLFFPLDGLIGAWSFLLFIIPLSLVTVFTYFNLPETKVLEASEIYELYDHLPTVRQTLLLAKERKKPVNRREEPCELEKLQTAQQLDQVQD